MSALIKLVLFIGGASFVILINFWKIFTMQFLIIFIIIIITATCGSIIGAFVVMYLIGQSLKNREI